MRICSGGVPEWPKGSDCKSDAKASQVRILPPPPLIARGHRIVAITSAFQADDAGSIPAARSNLFCNAHVAQLVEHTLGKGEVGGSNPPMSSIINPVNVTIQVD